MIVSLGLNGMNDDCYDESVVDDILHKFLWRQYKNRRRGLVYHKELYAGFARCRNMDPDAVVSRQHCCGVERRVAKCG